MTLTNSNIKGVISEVNSVLVEERNGGLMALGDLSHPLDTFFGNSVANAAASAQRRKRRIMAAIAAVVMIPAINSTLAADITLGSSDVEFGQGTATTSACDDSITIDLPSQLDGGGVFALEKIVLNDVDVSAPHDVGGVMVGCLGKTLHVHAFAGLNEIDLVGNSFASHTVADGDSSTIEITGINSGIDVQSITRVAVSTQ